MVTQRASKAFAAFRPEAQAAFVRALRRLSEQPQTAQLKHFDGNVEARGYTHALKASRELRVILSKSGEAWRIEDVVRRSDRRYYNHEA